MRKNEFVNLRIRTLINKKNKNIIEAYELAPNGIVEC